MPRSLQWKLGTKLILGTESQGVLHGAYKAEEEEKEDAVRVRSQQRPMYAQR